MQRRSILIVLVLALIVAACGSADTAETEAPLETEAPPTTAAPETTTTTTVPETTTTRSPRLRRPSSSRIRSPSSVISWLVRARETLRAEIPHARDRRWTVRWKGVKA